MRKRLTVLLVAVLAVLALGLGVGGAQASAVVSNADGSMTGQRAAAADPGYYGELRAFPTACVVVERKSNSNAWVRNGFESSGVIWNEFRICYDYNNNPDSWRIHTNSYPVNGLRFVSNQGLTKTMCTSAADCLSTLA